MWSGERWAPTIQRSKYASSHVCGDTCMLTLWERETSVLARKVPTPRCDWDIAAHPLSRYYGTGIHFVHHNRLHPTLLSSKRAIHVYWVRIPPLSPGVSIIIPLHFVLVLSIPELAPHKSCQNSQLCKTVRVRQNDRSTPLPLLFECPV